MLILTPEVKPRHQVVIAVSISPYHLFSQSPPLFYTHHFVLARPALLSFLSLTSSAAAAACMACRELRNGEMIPTQAWYAAKAGTCEQNTHQQDRSAQPFLQGEHATPSYRKQQVPGVISEAAENKDRPGNVQDVMQVSKSKKQSKRRKAMRKGKNEHERERKAKANGTR